MAKLKVNSYDTYNEFVKWAEEELAIVKAGDTNISIKPLDFRNCIFGLYQFLIEEATKGNKPKKGLSLSAVGTIGRELADKLYTIYSSNEETNNRNNLHSAYRYSHLCNSETPLEDIINLCNLIVSYPEENRGMLAKVLKKASYVNYIRFGTEDMYFIIKHFLDKCTEFEAETHRYLLTPQYVISDMLKIGSDLKQLASKVEPLIKLKVIEDPIHEPMFFRSRVVELPYEKYYNVVVSMIKHKVALDVILADTDDKSNRLFVELRNAGKFKAPITTISEGYVTDQIASILEDVLNVKGIGQVNVDNTPNLQLSDLHVQRYGDNVKDSIYDYFLDSEKTKEVCSLTTTSMLETHVYRRASKEDYENYIKPLRNYLCIKEVTVEEEFRGRGLLRQMLDSLKEEAKKEGVTKIVLQPYPIKSKTKASKSMELLQKDLVQKYSHLGFKTVVEGEVHGGVQFMLMELSLEDEVFSPKAKRQGIDKTTGLGLSNIFGSK